jgi:CDP-diglyceride synthetase
VRTILIVLGVWILINVLFVVIMIPPRKPRKPDPRQTGTLAPVPIDKNGYPFEDQEKLPLRHVIISIGMGTFFSLTAPLIEAVESIKRHFRKGRE